MCSKLSHSPLGSGRWSGGLRKRKRNFQTILLSLPSHFPTLAILMRGARAIQSDILATRMSHHGRSNAVLNSATRKPLFARARSPRVRSGASEMGTWAAEWRVHKSKIPPAVLEHDTTSKPLAVHTSNTNRRSLPSIIIGPSIRHDIG